MLNGWREAGIGFVFDKITIGGLEVWKHEWRKSSAESVMLPHPAYPNQIHRYTVFEIGPTDAPVRFAASELSNGVWGFYGPE